MTIQSFLEEVYALDAEETMDKAFDLVVSYTDDLFCANDFAMADRIFSEVDVDRISHAIITIFLRSTYMARPLLPSRPAFILKATDKIIAARGEKDA